MQVKYNINLSRRLKPALATKQNGKYFHTSEEDVPLSTELTGYSEGGAYLVCIGNLWHCLSTMIAEDFIRPERFMENY